MNCIDAGKRFIAFKKFQKKKRGKKIMMKKRLFKCKGRCLLIGLLFLCLGLAPTVEANALTIELGDYYYIASAADNNQVLDVKNGSHKNGANIQLHKMNGTDAQLFKFVKSDEKGYYYIINKGSGKAIDVAGGNTQSGTNVQLYEKNKTQAQKWKFYMAYNSDVNVSIRAYCGKFMDACGGETKNGTNIWIYDGNNTIAQAFTLIPYINTSYETVELDFDDLDSWKEELENAQRRVVAGGSMVTNPSGNSYYNGKIITDILVESTQSVRVKTPVAGPGNAYKWENIELPKKLRFKLHSHNTKVNTYFDFTALRFWQQCECGYRDEWTWEVPWPDLTDQTDTQTTQKVIEAIKPKQNVLYNLE